MKGNGLPPNIPLQGGIFNLEEIDLVDVLDARCAGYAIKGIQQAKDVDFTQTGSIRKAEIRQGGTRVRSSRRLQSS